MSGYIFRYPPFVDGAPVGRAFPRARILSWSSPVVQSLERPPHIACIGSRSHPAVGHFPGLVAFLGGHRLGPVKNPDASSLRLRLSFRVLPDRS
jgi:hypothetical protein